MNRRGFLSGIILAAAAPAIVRADSLMRVVPRSLVIATRPADILTGPFVTFTKETGYSWFGDGLLISDTIPGAARNVTIANGKLSYDFNPGKLPHEYANTANALLNNGAFQVHSFKVAK